MNLLSRDYRTPIKRFIGLLSRDHKTPIKILQDFYQGITAKHNKMLEYLNFCLICAIFASILYLYIRIKKYFPILKMAEELIGNLGYEALQSDTKRQKLLECILTRNSKISGQGLH